MTYGIASDAPVQYAEVVGSDDAFVMGIRQGAGMPLTRRFVGCDYSWALLEWW
jgi:hypothetical protein